MFYKSSSPQDPDDATVTTCTSSGSDSDEDVIPTAASIRSVRFPEFDDVVPNCDPVDNAPRVLHALCDLSRQVLELDVRAVDLYADLRAVSPLLSPVVAPKAHVDGGSIATTTDRLEYLFCYRKFTSDERRTMVRLKVADDTVHVPEGAGYIKVPCRNGPDFLFVRCFYTPQIPATILSPDSVAWSLQCSGCATFSDLVGNSASMQLVDCSDCGTSIEFALQLIRGLLFTDSLIAPTDPERSSETPPTDSSTIVASQIAPAVYGNSPKPIHALTADQQRALWHCRLGHTNARSVSDLHKFVDGVPKMTRDDPLSSCPLCKRAKLRKADRGPTEDAEPTECWQMIQIDVGFMIQKSDKKTKKNAQSEIQDSDGPASKKPRQKKARRLVANLRAMDGAPRRSSRNKRFAGSYDDTQWKRNTNPPKNLRLRPRLVMTQLQVRLRHRPSDRHLQMKCGPLRRLWPIRGPSNGRIDVTAEMPSTSRSFGPRKKLLGNLSRPSSRINRKW